MKAFAKEVPFDWVKGRGGKKSKYCRCCISKKISPGTKNQKTALRMKLKKSLKEEIE